MKKGKLKFLAASLVAGAALLFAGCNQQAQTPPPSGGGQPTPTVVAIEGVYDASTVTPVDPSNVSRLVIVRAKVTPGSVVPAKVQFLIDDEVRYEVSFGVGAQRVRAQENGFTFEWNLNTAAVQDFTPLFLNGSHSLKVRVVDEAGTAIAESQASDLVFNNSDFLALVVDGHALNKGGKRYYGGSDLTIEVKPILYSGKQVASVTLDVSGWGTPLVDLEPDVPGRQSAKTLTQAPYSFTVPYDANKNIAPASANFDSSYLSVTLTYADTTTLSTVGAVLDGDQVLYDNTGAFANNAPFGLSDIIVDFVAPRGATSAAVCRGNTQLTTTDFWANDANLLAGVDTLGDAGGVGGLKVVLDVKTTTNQPVLSDQEISVASACGNVVGPLSGLSEGGFYRVAVTAFKDDLGNERSLNTPLVSLAFAVDTTAPELALSPGRDNRFYLNDVTLTTGYDLSGNPVGPNLSSNSYAQVQDPPSGNPPVASGVSRYAWSANGKALPLPTTDAFPTLTQIAAVLGTAPQGYYDLSVKAVDGAGNASDPLELSALYDNTDPYVVFTQPTNTALTGGTAFTVTAHATDNVDLKYGAIYWSDDTNSIRFEAFKSQPNPWRSEITEEDYTATLTALKPTTGPTDFSLYAFVEDQAGNAPATAQLSTLTVTPANANSVSTVSGVTETPGITQASGGSTTLQITLSSGTAQVSAVHVYLWAANDGTYDYYDYVTDAVGQGGNTYAALVTVPANLGTPQVLIVVEHDNGKVSGYTYDYDANTLSLQQF